MMLSFKELYMLHEQSYVSELYSIRLLNLLFVDKIFTIDSYNLIKDIFPINDDDRINLSSCMYAITNNTKLDKIKNYQFIPFEFTSDYGLSILNKLFCSNNNRNEMINFLNTNIKKHLNDINVKRISVIFHKTFALD